MGAKFWGSEDDGHVLGHLISCNFYLRKLKLPFKYFVKIRNKRNKMSTEFFLFHSHMCFVQIYRENIFSRSGYGHEPAEKRTVDETKAPFFKYLLPLCQRKVDAIRWGWNVTLLLDPDCCNWRWINKTF